MKACGSIIDDEVRRSIESAAVDLYSLLIRGVFSVNEIVLIASLPSEEQLALLRLDHDAARSEINRIHEQRRQRCKKQKILH